MKPELKAILDGIGYSEALLYSRSIIFQFWEPGERGHRYFKDKAEAKGSLESLTKLTELLLAASPHLINLINDHSKSSQDWDRDRDPFYDVAHAIVDLKFLAELETSMIWDAGGASRRVAGEDIARHMAKVFVLGMGKMPGSGAKDGGSPSGPFPQAVHDVFHSIGIPDNFRRPCKKAVAWLKADDYREFNRLLLLRNTRGRDISSMVGSERN